MRNQEIEEDWAMEDELERELEWEENCTKCDERPFYEKMWFWVIIMIIVICFTRAKTKVVICGNGNGTAPVPVNPK